MKKKLLKLDLSFGELPPDCPFKRLVTPDKFPWKLANQSVEEAQSAYLLNRLTGTERIKFMDELWRVLIPEGKVRIIVPYWTSARAVQDPLTPWPPLVENSFLYFNKQWREANKIDHGIKCDYDFAYGYSLDPETQSRGDNTRPFWVKHYVNSILDLDITLTKRKV